MEVTKENPIIVSGAGPVGCAFAIYLALNEIPVVVLEAEAELPLTLRASTWHPPTLDMLDAIGMAAPLVKMGLKVPFYQFRDRKSDIFAQFELEIIADETKHPYRIQVEQFRFTKIAQVMLEALPYADIKFKHAVEAHWQDNDFVMTKVRTPEGTRDVRTPFLLGADGARSNVRFSSGIKFDGFTYPEKFLIASTPYPLENHIDNLSYVTYFADPDEWFLTLRCNELWRVLLPTPIGADPEELISRDNVERVLQGIVSKKERYEISHKTLYNVHQRVAETYHKGRVFLAGDAAHVNNPLGGMGMNGGIHDAFNLAEKMVNYLNGDANWDVFELYDRQRRILCTDFIQKQTISNKEMLENDDPEKSRKKIESLIEISKDPVKNKEFVRDNSMLNILKQASEIN